AHRHGVEAAPALIAVEYIHLSGIHAEPRRIDDGFGKGRDILQAHIEALPRDRVNDVRGVADQRQPVADKGARHEIAQRKRPRLFERAPSSATGRLAAVVKPAPSVTSTRSACESKPVTATGRRSMPSAWPRSTNASIR